MAEATNAGAERGGASLSTRSDTVSGQKRSIPRAGPVANGLLTIVPGALLIAFSFHAGGFFPGVTALAALGVLLILTLRVAFAGQPFEGLSLPYVVASSALGLFAMWTLASTAWSDAPARSLLEYNRALLYFAGFLLIGSLGRTTGRLRWMIRSIAAGTVVICVCALSTRLFPEVWPIEPGIADHRLSYPLTYWNALGLLAALGLVLCFALNCDDRESRTGRVLSAAALPVLAVTLLLTFSRGSIAVAIVGLLVVVIAGRPRALMSGVLVAIPTVGVALAQAYGADLLASVNSTSAAAAAQGKDVGVVVMVCVLLAALGRAALLVLDARLVAITIPPALSRPRVRWTMGLAAGLVVVAIALAASLPLEVRQQYHRFVQGSQVDAGTDLRPRLTNPDNNGRIEQWRVAIDAFRDQPLHGQGAGTYALRWDRDRPRSGRIEDAHSLYAEVLGELGIVGLALVLIALLTMLGGFLALARGPDRVIGGALLATGLMWSVHAGIEWDWELPAVTLWLFAVGGLALAAPAASRGQRPARAASPVARTILRRAVLVAGCLVLMLVPLRLYASEGPLRDSVRAFHRGDCTRAIDRALDSTAALATRPEPYVVVGYCDIRLGSPQFAVRAFRRALLRDPQNWELHYGLGIARAAAGTDPRPRLRIARRLNPREILPVEALAAFDSDDPKLWQRRAARARLPAD